MNTWVIAHATFGDAIRKRVLLVFLLIAFVMLTLALLLNYFTAREQSTIFKSTQLAIILIFGALISITTAVFLIPTEVERKTIYPVLAKPVQRWEFFLGKFFGGALTLGFMTGLMSLALVIVLFVLAARPPTSAADVQPAAQQALNLKDWFMRGGAEFMLVLRAVVVIYFHLLIVLSIATTLSLFLAPTVNFAVTAVIWVLGQFQDIVLNWSQQSPVLHWPVRLLSYAWPHFQDFNIMGSIIHPAAMGDFPHWPFAAGISLYGIFSAVVLMIGTLVFDRKEV
ncbi:MAG: hypothetical protein FJX77_04100 [Armatimonadetes bacterium]|nr:hypothetical protein [Armatimonadota bacterium]